MTLEPVSDADKKEADTVMNKKVFMNGEQLKGCLSVVTNFSMKNMLTEVTCTFLVKKDSLKITDNEISFDLIQ
jgi:hypothetical protein